MHMTIIGICAVHLTHCCNRCSTHNPTLVRGMQALNLCTYICCILLCRIPLLCGSTVCFAQMKDFNQAQTYKIKHHYEQETDKILRTNQFGDRWDVLSSPSTYITRPRWIYSRRSRIQKSISVQATKLVGFCDYFLHSHALERYTDRVKIVNLLPALHPLGKRIDSVPCVPLFIYHIILFLVILLRFLLFLYIFILFTVVFSVIQVIHVFLFLLKLFSIRMFWKQQPAKQGRGKRRGRQSTGWAVKVTREDGGIN